jgi:hypothetical protein
VIHLADDLGLLSLTFFTNSATLFLNFVKKFSLPPVKPDAEEAL